MLYQMTRLLLSCSKSPVYPDSIVWRQRSPSSLEATDNSLSKLSISSVSPRVPTAKLFLASFIACSFAGMVFPADLSQAFPQLSR
jgi:hypothetical protein